MECITTKEQAEEFEVRERLIEKTKGEIEVNKDKLMTLKSKISNTEYDLEHTFKDDMRLKKSLVQMKAELGKVKEVYDFDILDVERSETQLKKDKKWYYSNRRRFAILQERSLPTATRNDFLYEDVDEMRKICNCSNDADVLFRLAVELKRTFYAIEKAVRMKDYYLATGRKYPYSRQYSEKFYELLEEVK